jgi:hypothetical protein
MGCSNGTVDIGQSANDTKISGIWSAEVFGTIYLKFQSGVFVRQVNYANGECDYAEGTYTVDDKSIDLTDSFGNFSTFHYSIDDSSLVLSSTSGIVISIAYAKATIFPNHYATLFKNIGQHAIAISPDATQSWSDFNILPSGSYTLMLWVSVVPIYTYLAERSWPQVIDISQHNQVIFSDKPLPYTTVQLADFIAYKSYDCAEYSVAYSGGTLTFANKSQRVYYRVDFEIAKNDPSNYDSWECVSSSENNIQPGATFSRNLYKDGTFSLSLIQVHYSNYVSSLEYDLKWENPAIDLFPY